MHRLKAFRSDYFIVLCLILYGSLHRISTSELWPISISKTWYTPEQFEFSMLQKPLLSLFLSLFHLVPLNDSMHIITIKLVFAAIGALGLWALSKFIILALAPEEHKPSSIAFILLGLSLVSPTILNQFFSVRSDQLAASLFSFFLLFSFQKKFLLSVLLLALIPLSGVKEFFFLGPALLFFYFNFKHLISRSILLLSTYAVFAVLIWLTALNVPAVYYLLETFEQISFSSKFASYSFKVESLSLFLAAFSSLYILSGKLKKFRIYAIQTLYFFVVLILFPQIYTFMLASVLPFIFIPLILVILKISQSRPAIAASIFIGLCTFVLFTQINNKMPGYTGISEQLRYIKAASQIIENNNLTYLDGVGILPRQKHYPCFASPYDQVANSSCHERIAGQQLDSLIISSRLMYIGDQIFKVAEKDYVEILPNFWVNKNKITDEILKAKNTNADLMPAFVLF